MKNQQTVYCQECRDLGQDATITERGYIIGKRGEVPRKGYCCSEGHEWAEDGQVREKLAEEHYRAQLVRAQALLDECENGRQLII